MIRALNGTEPVLLLDNHTMGAAYGILIQELLRRKVRLFSTLSEAEQEIVDLLERNGENGYAAFLIEPFYYILSGSESHTCRRLKTMMVCARTGLGLPVVVTSTQSPEDIFAKSGLKKGEHYEEHVSKYGGFAEKLRTTVDRLLQQETRTSGLLGLYPNHETF
ncbi:MAG: hypothetical protein V1659_01755 [Candidatus Woesearchaeota archaeon]